MTQPPNQSIPAQPPRGGENTRFDPSLGELVGLMWQRRGVALISFAVVLVLAAIVMGQCEGICFDGEDLIVSNEQRGLYRIEPNRLQLIIPSIGESKQKTER